MAEKDLGLRESPDERRGMNQAPVSRCRQLVVVPYLAGTSVGRYLPIGLEPCKYLTLGTLLYCRYM